MADAPVFLTARWQSLAMLNFEVDPRLLQPLVPRGTELDLWRGKALVSLVGFLFLDARLLGWPVPFHGRFEEVNLRFYVRRELPGETRRGVVFVKEIAPRTAVAIVANRVYHENYITLPMRHEVQTPGTNGHAAPAASYQWRLSGRWHGLSVQGQATRAADDSQEAFVVEHYWGYTRRPAGGTLEYHVAHPRWAVWPASRARLDADVAALYGPKLAPFLNVEPCSACWVDGSAVTVHRGTVLC